MQSQTEERKQSKENREKENRGEKRSSGGEQTLVNRLREETSVGEEPKPSLR
jgi:hypothetical protein